MRFAYRAAGPIAAAAALTLLTGCSRTQQDWWAAQQAGTAQAYGVFARRHPDSELAGVARQRVAQLTEEAAWQRAMRANTVASYQAYLTRYPNGSWSQDARIRMESRSLATEPAQVSQSGQSGQSARPAQSSQGAGPLVLPIVQRVATAAQDASADGITGRRAAVQLGAFSSVANAHSAWDQVSSRFRAELRGLTPLTVPVMSSGRRFYRLEARVADQTAARQLCRQLQRHSQGCLPLP